MTDPTDSLRTYVRAALELQGYAFSDGKVAEITTQFARIVAIAETILPAAMRLLGLGGTYPRGPYMPIEDSELTALSKVLREVGEQHDRPELIPG